MDGFGIPPAVASDATGPDFASLREHGIAVLQRLAGTTWTDHNTHDPGITILEQLCYALTDLGYRAGYDLPDLLAGAGEDAYASIYSPAQILPTSPVTLADLRKLVIDVPGVKNAWIDVADEPSASFDAAKGDVSYLVPDDAGRSARALSPNVSEVRVRGLYRVRIEKSDMSYKGGSEIRRDAALRLNRWRGLGQDFQKIEVLDQQAIGLAATLEIGAVEDATALLASVYESIATYLSPSVMFHTLDEMLERGRRVDEIFDGPLLEHGFIDSEELAQIGRRTSLRVSDLIHRLMAVPGVAAVKSLRFLAPDGTQTKDWLLSVDADKTPWFNLKNSDIRLENRGLRVDQGIQAAAQELFDKRAKKAASPVPLSAAERDLRPPPGRDRKLASYFSVQRQFPMVYAIGAAGLPQSAPSERRALAMQLKAYMMFYDQLLANQFAQLANMGKLFSFHDETQDSYFSEVVQDDGTLGLDAVRASDPDKHSMLLQQITENPLKNDDDPGARRRNRFLDHLLARFGEQFRDYALLRSGRADAQGGVKAEAQLARDKRAFLRDYPRIGRDRGAAFSYLEPAGEENVSGLEQTLRRKLGINDPEERFYLVEHILLRPIPGDVNQSGPLFRSLSRGAWSLGGEQGVMIEFVGPSGSVPSVSVTMRAEATPEFSITDRALAIAIDGVGQTTGSTIAAAWNDWKKSHDASGFDITTRGGGAAVVVPGGLKTLPVAPHPAGGDPYSHQISLVFPNWPERFKDRNFRQFVERTVQEETPAHLGACVLWKDEAAMQMFKAAYARWLDAWRNHRAAEWGI